MTMEEKVNHLIMTLLPNRVRRNYLGGAGIDQFHGYAECIDNDRPEEWIGSLVNAHNPGMETIEQEGLSRVSIDGEEHLLKNIILQDPIYYLGDLFQHEKEPDLGFLFKILDSSMRLHVQAHPTKEFAMKYLGNPYGKQECYYILNVRSGIEPYIRLGFQNAPSKARWREIIEEQNIEALDACFEKISVKPGQVWYIPGGMPHAIGKGITMLEIMEPSDLVVRCEFNREGVIVPAQARFMGKDLEFCLDIFDYKQYSVVDIVGKSLMEPKVLVRNEDYCIEKLIDTTVTSSFEVVRLTVIGKMIYKKENKPQVGIVCKGCLKITTDHCSIVFKKGDSFFIAAALKQSILERDSEEILEICMVSNNEEVIN
ncbi:type I phosphomannose isomerase catalytic subunit [Clostridium sp. CF012]|uniref:type I phosphomannose isomerase catalytic subunit n=1 Tax=Clostridium sp. CF012 TaxID=2843319 RepID=UPI001C0CA9ED|nr:type I phosphomannose isomerase catalytic subunit [Clostridium sp. CF012]MBU3142895.1 mannose-6-phosphate isomerase [Clostridium sp. CF012]